jgi:hypothetical protein
MDPSPTYLFYWRRLHLSSYDSLVAVTAFPSYYFLLVLETSRRRRVLDPWPFEGILHKALDPETARSLQDAIATNVRLWV